MARKALAFRRGAGAVGTLIAYDLVSGAPGLPCSGGWLAWQQ